MKFKSFLFAVLLTTSISTSMTTVSAQEDNGGIRVPDAGATVLLLGAAVGAIALVRARRRK
jgi:uncharacterized membrane protein YdjX (TVP38/TMEM64 family)